MQCDALQIVRSQRLDYDGLLRRLPTSGFWEIRASLLERMERQDHAERALGEYFLRDYFLINLPLDMQAYGCAANFCTQLVLY